MLMTDKLNRNIYSGELIGNNPELTSELRLWRFVICQAISDSYLGTNREKITIGLWIRGDDFTKVCDLADLNSENVRKSIYEILMSKPIIARHLGEKLKKFIQNHASRYY